MSAIVVLALSLVSSAGGVEPQRPCTLSQSIATPETCRVTSSGRAPADAALANAAAPCARSLYNGMVLAGDYPVIEHPHQLTIQNQHGTAAFVKVVNVQTRQRTLFYVEARQSASLTNIPDGIYNIAYASSGHLAADCETVIRPDAAMMFPGPQTFTTKQIGDQIETAELSYTLFRVSNGNVKPKPISVAAFNAD